MVSIIINVRSVINPVNKILPKIISTRSFSGIKIFIKKNKQQDTIVISPTIAPKSIIFIYFLFIFFYLYNFLKFPYYVRDYFFFQLVYIILLFFQIHLLLVYNYILQIFYATSHIYISIHHFFF